MTTLYHSYSYTPYENAPIEPYNYPEGQVITRELIEDTAILQVLLREILMLFQEYIKNLLMKLKKLLLTERQRRIINVGKDIVI